jgi:dolichyl-phosphate beta-glucosyltransferase
VVVPVFNEEKRLCRSLKTISKYLKQHDYDYEIIVVDDGSKDHSLSIAKYVRNSVDENVCIVENKINRGKGYSVKNGFLHARGDYLLFLDADLSTPIDEIEKFLTQLDKGYDIAIGSRALKGADVQVRQPWYREMMGRIFNILVRALVMSRFKDTQCGFKMFTREAALGICKRQTVERFSFDVEMLYIARKHGYKIIEIPVRWANEPDSRVHLIKDTTKMLIDLMRIRLGDLLGRYT